MKLQLMRLRKQAGYKNRESIAAALGMSERRYKSIEAGEVRLTLEEACYIADFFNCTLDELAGRSFSPKAYSDPMQAELNRCYEVSTVENRNGLLLAARNAALASGEATKRDDVQGEGVSA